MKHTPVISHMRRHARDLILQAFPAAGRVPRGKYPREDLSTVAQGVATSHYIWREMVATTPYTGFPRITSHRRSTTFHGRHPPPRTAWSNHHQKAPRRDTCSPSWMGFQDRCSTDWCLEINMTPPPPRDRDHPHDPAARTSNRGENGPVRSTPRSSGGRRRAHVRQSSGIRSRAPATS